MSRKSVEPGVVAGSRGFLLSLTFGLVSTAAIAGYADAQQESDPADTASKPCRPPCRKTYTCIEGECVSLCNPPCAAGERCTERAECVPTAPAGGPSGSHSGWMAPSGPAPGFGHPGPAPAVTKRFDDRGPSASVSLGPVFCVAPDSCNSFTELDLGVGLDARIGYRFAPWVRLDVGGAFTYRFTEQSVEYDYALYWFAVNAGMTVFPLSSRYVFDLVLGLHTGYVRSVSRSHRDGDEPTPAGGIISEMSFHQGFDLVETVGFVAHVSEHLALGLVYDVHYFLFIHHCAYWGSQELAPDDSCEYEDGGEHGWAYRLAVVLEMTF